MYEKNIQQNYYGHAAPSAYLIILDLTTLIILGDECEVIYFLVM